MKLMKIACLTLITFVLSSGATQAMGGVDLTTLSDQELDEYRSELGVGFEAAYDAAAATYTSADPEMFWAQHNDLGSSYQEMPVYKTEIDNTAAEIKSRSGAISYFMFDWNHTTNTPITSKELMKEIEDEIKDFDGFLKTKL